MYTNKTLITALFSSTSWQKPDIIPESYFFMEKLHNLHCGHHVLYIQSGREAMPASPV